MESSWADDFPLPPSLTSLSLRVRFYSNFWEVDFPISSPASSSLLLPNIISPPSMLELSKAKGVECEETKGFV